MWPRRRRNRRTGGDEQRIRLAVPPHRSGGERVSHVCSSDDEDRLSGRRTGDPIVGCDGPVRERRGRLAIRFLTDPETGVASGVPEAAICVQDLDVQCVLQFTLINAAGCALHRRTNRVIHRQECFQRSSSLRRRLVDPPRRRNGRTVQVHHVRCRQKVTIKATPGRPPLVGGRDERSSGSLNLAEATAFDAAGHRMPDDDRRPPVLSPRDRRDRYPRRRHR